MDDKHKRKGIDTFYNDNMKRLEELGRHQTDESKPQTSADMNAVREIRSIQKELNKALDLKMADNRKRGRYLGDGEDY